MQNTQTAPPTMITDDLRWTSTSKEAKHSNPDQEDMSVDGSILGKKDQCRGAPRFRRSEEFLSSPT